MDDDNTQGRDPTQSWPALPRAARLPINRCDLPAEILGGLSFQRHPAALHIDGVASIHRRLFSQLVGLTDATQRRRLFSAHMQATFLLEHPDEAGHDPSGAHPGRYKADYLRLLRGWMFDSNGREGAVLKGWVESRFGLLPRSHRGPLRSADGPEYRRYLTERCAGLRNTNALEAQLDLLYAYCQFELALTARAGPHLTLYRGTNGLDDYEVVADDGPGRPVLLLNNLNSFSASAERADEFGDVVFAAEVPLSKLVFFPGLLQGTLRGEDEHLVIGGLYRVQIQQS